MIDQEYFQQQYLKSMVYTRRLYEQNLERWHRKKEQQLANVMEAHTNHVRETQGEEVIDGGPEIAEVL